MCYQFQKETLFPTAGRLNIQLAAFGVSIQFCGFSVDANITLSPASR